MSIVPASDDLTRREWEVAVLVAQGFEQKQIARQLGVERITVAVHVHNIADKLPGPGRPAIRITRFVLMAASTQMAA